MEANAYLLNRIAALQVSNIEKVNKVENFDENNKNKIEELKNKYQNKRCFIIGGSPSINSLDLSKLKKEYTFTVNRGYKIRNEKYKKSTFHVMSDIKTFTEDKVENEIPKDFADLFFIYGGINFPFDENVAYFDFKFSTVNTLKQTFQTDLLKPLAACPSIVLICIQIAVYLGFSKIYLIGFDMDFKKNQGHAYFESEGEKRRQKVGAEENNVKFVLDSLNIVNDLLKKLGINLYNASPSGILDCMERVKFEDLF